MWGSWCDPCGGVYIRPGVQLIRHVATVEGAGGRFPIVFDLSTSDYAYVFKDPHTEAPVKRDMDGFHRSHLRIAHGTLDAAIALSYPDAKGNGTEVFLSAAPSSTHEERKLVLG